MGALQAAGKRAFAPSRLDDIEEEAAAVGHVPAHGVARFETYEDSAGEYRWRLRHQNGNILADSGEGYADRTTAYDGIESGKRNASNADLDESDAWGDGPDARLARGGRTRERHPGPPVPSVPHRARRTGGVEFVTAGRRYRSVP
jgi:uncharacterized protein YegP (UPF0339 family)